MKHFFKRATALCLSAVMAAGLCVTGFAADGDSTSDVQYQVEYKQTDARNTLQYVNAFRTDDSQTWYWNSDNTTKTTVSGLGTLVYDYDLEEAAMQRAAEIAIYFSHTRPDGQSWNTAIKESGYSYSSAGENLAAGTYYYVGTPADVIEQLKETDEDYAGQGHRRNMLVSSYTNYAMGCVYMNNTYYWAMLLTKADGKNTTSPTTAVNSTATATVSVDNSRIQFGSTTFHDMAVNVGSSATLPDLDLYIQPSWAASNKSVSVTPVGNTVWSSSDSSVASISGNQVTANKAGEATISATVGGMTVSFKIYAEAEVSAVYIEPKESTSTEHGNIGYWYVAETNQYFLDEALTQEVSYEDILLPLALDEDIGETSHHWVVSKYNWTENGSTATCTATIICENCGETDTVECEISIEEEIGGEDHSEELTIIWKATVIYEGEELGSDTYTQVIYPDGGHVPGAGGVSFAWADDYSSCDAYFTCAFCGEEIYVPCHVDMVSGEATCTEPGYYSYIASCNINGSPYSNTKQSDIVSEPALGHDYGEPEFVWGSNYNSATAVFLCTRCGDRQTAYCTVTSAITTQPTCDEAGVRTYTATVTFEGRTYTDHKTSAIAPTGEHTWDSGTVIKEPTCTEEGTMRYTCIVCGATYETSIPALGHDYQIKEVVEPTCTSDGYTVYACTRCGDSYTTDETAALGHSYGDPAFDWSDDYSSCTAVFTCSRCGDVVSLACTVTDSITKQPTCVEEGTHTYTASVSFDGNSYQSVKTVSIPATGEHVWDSGVITRQPTCTAEGVMTFTCQQCGKTETSVIEALGHDFNEPVFNWSSDHATCTVTITCSRGDFDQTYNCTVTSEVTKEAGCENLGTTAFTAYYKDDIVGECYNVETVANIPATDHTYEGYRFVWIDKNGRTWEYGDDDTNFVWEEGVSCTGYFKCKVCGKEWTTSLDVQVVTGYTSNGLVATDFKAMVGDELVYRVRVMNGSVVSVQEPGGTFSGEELGDYSAQEANSLLDTVLSSDIYDNLSRGISLEQALSNVDVPSSAVTADDIAAASGLSRSGLGDASDSGTVQTDGAKTDDQSFLIDLFGGLCVIGLAGIAGTVLFGKQKEKNK